MMNLRSYVPFYKRNLNLALPLMITQAGQMVVQFADNIMVAKLGTLEFAGVAFANTIITVGIIFATCFTQGSTPLVGQQFGKGNLRNVGQYLQNSLIIDTALAVLVPLLFALIIPFMSHMGQEAGIVPFAISYYKIVILSFAPYILFFAIRNFSEGLGVTIYAMYITIACNVINIVLNWVLIYGHWGMPAYGVDGAAYATLISRVFMMVAFIVILFKLPIYNQYLKFFSRPFINPNKFKRLLKTSFPISLQGLADIMVFSVAGIIIGFFGKEAMAAQQIVFTVTSASYMVAQGLSIAGTITVAHQNGENNRVGTRMAGYATMHLAFVCMMALGVLIILFRTPIGLVFSHDPAVLEYTNILFIIALVYLVFDAYQLAALAALRGLGDVKIPMYMAVFAYYVLCIPVGYFCGVILNMGPTGVYIGIIVGMLVSSVLFVSRFERLTKG